MAVPAVMRLALLARHRFPLEPRRALRAIISGITTAAPPVRRDELCPSTIIQKQAAFGISGAFGA